LFDFRDNTAQSYITDLVKKDLGHTATKLRHFFANQQIDLWGNYEKASKNSMGHHAVKNMAYYVDFLELTERIGLEKTEAIIQKSEMQSQYSLMRLAVRVELKIIFSDLT
ncbi:MAG: hypothetical protein KAS32_21705, partial [Candidatus Peribacteraceae bacterium]|nr:hypothetical protein [Candidatus Peribacteraceae bacterium]